MRHAKGYSPDDVLLLSDGRMVQIVEAFAPWSKELSVLQFVDRSEESYVEINSLSVDVNLGHSSEVLAAFYAARSVHLRLNQLSKV